MKCICCNKFIKSLNDDMSLEEAIFTVEEKTEVKIAFPTTRYIKAENRMWGDGVVGNISGGYGSIHDGDEFVIAICDECIKEKKECGVLVYTGNYMFKGDDIKQEVDKYRKIWRRNNNLDKLL